MASVGGVFVPRLVKLPLLIALLMPIVFGVSLLGGSSLVYLRGNSDLVLSGRAVEHNLAATVWQSGWRHIGGDPGGARFGNFNQISPQNVAALTTAWTFQTGDLDRHSDVIRQSSGTSTPIMADGKLVFCTPFNEVLALDPGNGKLVWRYDAEIDLAQRPSQGFACAGVVAWASPRVTGTCQNRLFMGTNDGRLIAIDATRGTACKDFGRNGVVIVDPGVELVWPGEFQITSPPVIVGDTVIVGSAMADDVRVDAPSGSIRAYDAVTGKPRWSYDPVPRSRNIASADTWLGRFPPREGGANARAPMSVDPRRGLVFVATASPTPNHFGGLRPGNNEEANSIVALDAATGRQVWSYQTVHHDLWDYDLSMQPGLYTITTDEERRDVVVEVTPAGHVFVLDRETGRPVFPVDERAVPQRAVLGEIPAATQRFPALPPPLVPGEAQPRDAFGLTWFDRQSCKRMLQAAWTGGHFAPPSRQGTLVYPASDARLAGGGAAYDPTRNLLIATMPNIAEVVELIPANRVDEGIDAEVSGEVAHQAGAPFAVRRTPLVSPIGLPCTPPPWGVLVAVDLGTGEIVWRKPLGSQDVMDLGLSLPFGSAPRGGPIATSSGLVFVAATSDAAIRAFNVETGRELWQAPLPAAGYGTPMTYAWKGQQYVLIYAGGDAAKPGDSVIAFALPQ